MSNTANEVVATEASLPSTDAKPKVIQKKTRRQGKGSREKHVTEYRNRVNAQVADRATKDAMARLNLLTDDESQQLNAVINSVQMVTQHNAVPLTVTTRGIGFATAIFYDRAMTTWTVEGLYSIATIHQVYRVALWLLHYKVYCAQQIQSELVSGDALQRIFITDEVREILDAVMEVPSVFSVVLESIGKIETQTNTYHVGYAREPSAPGDLLEYRTLVITPENVRSTLEFLANPDTPDNLVEEFRRYNSIPGLFFENGRPTNINTVYPSNYDVNQLLIDVHAFKNLISRIQSRLPKHTIVKHMWSGRAAKAGLWSCARIASNITASFTRIEIPSRRVRDEKGNFVQSPAVPPQLSYRASVVTGEKATYWSREETPHDNIVVGIASMVGEGCFVHTRYQLGCGYSTANNATNIQIMEKF